jgi:hypothetical protein
MVAVFRPRVLNGFPAPFLLQHAIPIQLCGPLDAWPEDD